MNFHQENAVKQSSPAEIAQCISVLENLISDVGQLALLPHDQRIAGQLTITIIATNTFRIILLLLLL